MSIPTILIIGDKGFVGSHLKARLSKAYSDVNILTFYRDSLLKALDMTGLPPIDAIVNCAAELTDETKMVESNVNLVARLLEFARAHKVPRFIQIGSSSEYGKTNEARREDLVCEPTNTYEATKLTATEMCLAYAKVRDMDVVVARPFSLYGPNDKPRKLIPTLYRSLLDHSAVSVHGDSTHDWLWIDDFIDGLILLLNAPRAQTQGQIFNFGTGVSSTNRQIVDGLEQALRSKLNVTYQTARYHAHDVDHWVADATKARTILGWAPKHDLAAGLQAYVMAEWFGAEGDQG